MLDVVLAVETPARQALAPSVPGLTVPLYVGLTLPTSATIRPPYAWLREGSEAPFAPSVVAGTFEEVVYLDLYARSSGELSRMENAVAFLDDYNPIPYGNAVRIRYRVQSKTRISEAEGTAHTTTLFAARYADKRKLVVPME